MEIKLKTKILNDKYTEYVYEAFDIQNREETTNVKNLDTIVLSTDEVIIYTIYPRRAEDEWDTKYPFRSIYFKDEKWQRVNTVSPALDIAFLCYLEYKYLGDNSRFTDFALKMLEIKIEE